MEQDAKVVDNACVALSHIAEALPSHKGLVSQLCGDGRLLTETLKLVSTSPPCHHPHMCSVLRSCSVCESLSCHHCHSSSSPHSKAPLPCSGSAIARQISLSDSGAKTSQLSLSTFFSLIKLLTTCVRGSPYDVTKTLVEGGVLETLRQLLASSSMLIVCSGGAATASSSVVRTTEQLHTVVLLLSEMLPETPDAMAAVRKGSLTQLTEASSSSEEGVQRGFLLGEPLILERLGAQFLPLLLQVYSSTVMQQVGYFRARPGEQLIAE